MNIRKSLICRTNLATENAHLTGLDSMTSGSFFRSVCTKRPVTVKPDFGACSDVGKGSQESEALCPCASFAGSVTMIGELKMIQQLKFDKGSATY